MDNFRIWIPVIVSIIGTIVTIATFYRNSRKDYALEYERRIADAEERARQHTEITMKMDSILNNHNKLEKDVIQLDIRMGNVENRLTKNESEHDSARTRFERIEKLLDN